MGDSRTKKEQQPSSQLVFFVNGKKVVEENPNPEWTLLHFLRFKLHLSGTKEACGEGGCGICTVLQSKFDENLGKIINLAINACLTPLCSCHASSILTTEGLGSTRTGLHPVQERIAKSHGTQCGYCTPGFVMSMYALLRNNPEPTEEELEDAFQGNLCRCTGYRPILQGYKTLCKKTVPSAQQNGEGCCGGVPNGKCCMMGDTKMEVADTLFDESQFIPYDPKQDIIFPPELQIDQTMKAQTLQFKSSEVTWLKPGSMQQLLEWKQQWPEAKLIGGNTEIGVETRFKQLKYPVLIQVTNVKELTEIQVENDILKVGGAASLSKLKDFCNTLITSSNRPTGTVEIALAEMLHWFAGQQIRNMATIAGNIVTASPISDLNPILMACGARLKLCSLKDGARRVVMDHTFFPRYRTTGLKPYEIVESVEIPLTKKNEFAWAIKQARRREDDIAIVNACMRIVLQPETKLITDCSLVFGGMAPTTKLAQNTSNFFISKTLTEETLEAASDLLSEELKLSPDTPGGMVLYRQVLCQSFLRKFYLAVSSWNSKLPSLTRGPTSGVQLYQIVPRTQSVDDLIGRPIPHMSSLKHATGEAIYTDDELPLSDQLYGYILGSPIAHGRILSVDATKALATPGVVEFISAKDLPKSRNLCGPVIMDEEIFASEMVHCQGQTIGIVVATDPLLAEKAAKLVNLRFEEYPPILTIEEALQKENYHGIRKLKAGDIESAFKSCDRFLEGEMRIGGQEHFYMETQSCIATPREDNEMDILMSCQGPELVQRSVAKALGIPQNRVKIRCRRMGGAFGGKETRSIMVSLPTAIAADILGRSVRTVMSRCEDMVSTGGRHPFLFRYRVGFTNQGRILALKATLASNAGWSWDSSLIVMEKALITIDAAYTINNWNVTGYVCKTNLASNTAFRGFGGPQASIFMESVLDLVAETLGMSPVKIREMHLKVPGVDNVPLGYPVEPEDCTVRKCWEEVVRMSHYEQRRLEVDKWNKDNQWRKRGITVMPMKHEVGFHFGPMNQAGALVMIYTDGSVGLNHGGTEMGQGLGTKMAQVASRVLGVSMDKIYFTETSTDKVPNTSATCGSFSSDLNGMAVKDACETLNKRLGPIKKKYPNGCWEEWIQKAYFERINLSAVGFYEVDLNFDFEKPEDKTKKPFLYAVYGAAVSEVEVDILTGDHSVLRTDIVIDVGESLNPAVDVGQIEGAFMQGYGLFTLEELLYSPKGLMLTKGPGMYKIPGMGDVPREFNVAFLRGAKNPKAVFSSRGLGEPPLFLAASVYFAIKEALKASRKDRQLSTAFRLDCPATAERIRMAVEDETVKKIRKQMEKDSQEQKGASSWAVTV